MNLTYMKKLLSVLLLILMVGCLDRGPADDSPVIAEVNGAKLTLNQLKKQIPAEYLKTLGSREKQAYVDQWVRQQLLYQLALEEDLKDEPQIQFRLKQFEQQLLADEILQRRLENEGQVSEAEALKYYEANTDEFMREEAEVEVRHIVVGEEELALDIRQRIQDGEDFAALAKEYSEDETSMTGGNLGYFSESEANDELTQAAFELKVNEVSEPIETPFGYHLVMVTDRQEIGSIRPFDQVKLDIINNLVLEKQKTLTTDLMENLKKEADIMVYSERLNQL